MDREQDAVSSSPADRGDVFGLVQTVRRVNFLFQAPTLPAAANVNGARKNAALPLASSSSASALTLRKGGPSTAMRLQKRPSARIRVYHPDSASLDRDIDARGNRLEGDGNGVDHRRSNSLSLQACHESACLPDNDRWYQPMLVNAKRSARRGQQQQHQRQRPSDSNPRPAADINVGIDASHLQARLPALGIFAAKYKRPASAPQRNLYHLITNTARSSGNSNGSSSSSSSSRTTATAHASEKDTHTEACPEQSENACERSDDTDYHDNHNSGVVNVIPSIASILKGMLGDSSASTSSSKPLHYEPTTTHQRGVEMSVSVAAATDMVSQLPPSPTAATQATATALDESSTRAVAPHLPPPPAIGYFRAPLSDRTNARAGVDVVDSGDVTSLSIRTHPDNDDAHHVDGSAIASASTTVVAAAAPLVSPSHHQQRPGSGVSLPLRRPRTATATTTRPGTRGAAAGGGGGAPGSGAVDDTGARYQVLPDYSSGALGPSAAGAGGAGGAGAGTVVLVAVGASYSSPRPFSPPHAWKTRPLTAHISSSLSVPSSSSSLHSHVPPSSVAVRPEVASEIRFASGYLRSDHDDAQRRVRAIERRPPPPPGLGNVFHPSKVPAALVAHVRPHTASLGRNSTSSTTSISTTATTASEKSSSDLLSTSRNSGINVHPFHHHLHDRAESFGLDDDDIDGGGIQGLTQTAAAAGAAKPASPRKPKDFVALAATLPTLEVRHPSTPCPSSPPASVGRVLVNRTTSTVITELFPSSSTPISISRPRTASSSSSFSSLSSSRTLRAPMEVPLRLPTSESALILTNPSKAASLFLSRRARLLAGNTANANGNVNCVGAGPRAGGISQAVAVPPLEALLAESKHYTGTGPLSNGQGGSGGACHPPRVLSARQQMAAWRSAAVQHALAHDPYPEGVEAGGPSIPSRAPLQMMLKQVLSARKQQTTTASAGKSNNNDESHLIIPEDADSVYGGHAALTDPQPRSPHKYHQQPAHVTVENHVDTDALPRGAHPSAAAAPPPPSPASSCLVRPLQPVLPARSQARAAAVARRLRKGGLFAHPDTVMPDPTT